ncbi:hypothetical protein [Novosphingobium terrae]|uniref:hypothetical protein n=1 Tax=Novosphingobium terrae TaxID=2726189 RepID=UPI00197D46ED|nr:hypothetical protein [Novosphingobium terrae]
MIRTAITAGALLAMAPAAMAQQAPSGEPRDRSVYFSAEQMQAIEDGAKDKTSGAPAAFSKRLITASTHSTSLIRLLKPDTPHAHAVWSEIFVVRAGSGILETGGTITGVTGHDSATHKDMFLDPQAPPPAGAKRPAGNANDLAGTGIDGGVQQHVKAGDIVLVPAGVAHRWLKVEEPVIYLDIKFPKAD